MKRILYIIILSLCITACEDNNSAPSPAINDHTLLMYLPWSGDATESGGRYNLISYFYNNISAIRASIETHGLQSERVLVFLSTSPTQATLYEIEYNNGTTFVQPINNYTDPAITTVEGIASILSNVTGYAPARKYSMIIGSHGMGWIPAQTTSRMRGVDVKMHWEYEGAMMTRYFGGAVAQYQTNISTLAAAIVSTGIKMEYILFDDCYLSTVEVAYDLKDATDYVIACPTEIMAHGMPYDLIGRHLLGDPDYESIVEEFYEFYSTYTVNGDAYPYGTIGVTDCSELDELAAIMKEINRRFTFDPSLRSSVQKMDGYSSTIFFDCGDYVAKLCSDTDLLNRFNTQLARTVPYKRNTPYYYSTSNGANLIRTYSGITISDPSVNSLAVTKTETAWYAATH